jgi:formate dehydrogenase alpha subunit
MKRVSTICPYCGTGCNIYLTSKNGRVVGVYPSRHNEINSAKLCVKGWNIPEFITHPDRLKKPLIRKNGELTECEWEEALAFSAQKLLEIKTKNSPDAIGVIGSARCTNEELYLAQKFARAAIGTNNIDHCARICHAPTVTGLIASLGSGGMTNPIHDIKNAKTIILIGGNPFEAHPIIAGHIIDAIDNGTELIVADPRRTRLCGFAAMHLQLKPGSDIALINAMAKVIIDENLTDQEFIKNNTEKYEEFKESFKDLSLEEAQFITGIDKEEIRLAARRYATQKPSSIIYTLGITEHYTGTANVRALANLTLLTGNIGKPGSGINPLRGQNNVQGGCDMGVAPFMLPGYKFISPLCGGNSDKKTIKKYEEVCRAPFPPQQGLMTPQMIEGALRGDIKAMWIMGEDFLTTEANAHKSQKALENLHFLIVSDLFLTPTAQRADVVFPACTFAEKEGTFTNTERRVQRIHKVIEPLGESKSDLEIISLLSSKMNYLMEYESAEEVFEEMKSLTPQYAGINYGRIESEGGIQWPCPKEDSKGTPILHSEGIARGKGEFYVPEFLEPREIPDEKFPFYLSTGRILFHYNCGSMSGRTTRLAREFSENFVMINPEDARRFGIEEHEEAVVSTRRGEITVRAKITDETAPGLLWMPINFYKSRTNVLTNDAMDEKSGVSEVKVCAAAIKRSEK